MRTTEWKAVLAGVAVIAAASVNAGTPAFVVCGFDPNSVRFDVTGVVQRAKANDAAANYDLGVMFLCGHQVPMNRYVAYEYFKRASDLGYGYASLLLGWCGEFNSSYKERGLSICENVPHRALIAERGDYILYCLHPQDEPSPREFYVRAVSNGVVEAENFINRLDGTKRAEDARRRAAQEAAKRVAKGDCRNDRERERYRQHVEQQERYRQNNEARLEKMKREEDERRSNLVMSVKREATRWQAAQVERLQKAERGDDAKELYWAACFLRAWAATASGDDPNRRVELARRSLECLRRASGRGHTEASFRLGLMLWGGDTGVIGPDPQGRGGFLDFNSTNRVMHEWVPEGLEVVKKNDLKGPSFAPYVRVRKICQDGAVTNVEKVLVYEQDIPCGMSLIRKAAASGFAAAKGWLAGRAAAGFADDFMPWMCDDKAFDDSQGRDFLEITVRTRSNDFLGNVFRRFKYDRHTGELIARSGEDPQRKAASPWIVNDKERRK